MRMIVRAILLLTLLFASSEAFAKGPYDLNGPFGLGAIIGYPTGVTGKLYFSERHSLDVSGTWSFRHESVLIFADYNFIFGRLIPSTDKGQFHFAPYVGIGGFAGFGKKLANGESGLAVGPRVPLGFSVFAVPASLDIFIELVPLLEIIPEVKFHGNGYLGVRYHF
ncbi:MAG: hypothetical protein GMKNLPBB_01143 [Myxococcota bacterium]|nr:hypothetical protein [Myxococcota bacterium]